MKKLKLYLDTSVISFIHADDAAGYRDVTIDFFENYLDSYEVFISAVVLVEIERTNDAHRKELLRASVEKYGLEVYNDLNADIEDLADKYVRHRLIPQKKFDDALHIAFCTYYEFDILLSWNFRHLANIMKQSRINSFNESEGYFKRLNIITPMEVIYEK